MEKTTNTKKLVIWVSNDGNHTSVTFVNCDFYVNNNYIIISTEEKDGSKLYEVYPLNIVKRFKTYNNL